MEKMLNSLELYKLFEYDLKSEHKITLGKFFFTNDLKLPLQKKVNKQLKLFFGDNNDYVNNHDKCFLMYDAPKFKKLDLIYHFQYGSSDSTCITLNDLLKLKSLNLYKNTFKFLEKKQNTIDLLYIGFDLNDNLTKIGFVTDKKVFLELSPETYYQEYVKMDRAIDFIKNYYSNENNDQLFLQYFPYHQSFIGIELQIHNKKDLLKFFKNLLKYELIDENQYLNFNIINSKNTNEDDFYILKLRWQNENDFMVKFYIQEFPS